MDPRAQEPAQVESKEPQAKQLEVKAQEKNSAKKPLSRSDYFGTKLVDVLKDESTTEETKVAKITFIISELKKLNKFAYELDAKSHQFFDNLVKETEAGLLGGVSVELEEEKPIKEDCTNVLFIDSFGNSRTPLQWAVFYNLPKCAKLLLEVGAQPAYRANLHSALTLAAHLGRREFIPLFAEHIEKKLWDWHPPKAWLNEEHGFAPIHFAVAANQSEFIRDMLNAGASSDITNTEGEPPLMMAIRLGRSSCIQVFLDLKAGLNTADNYGNTPLIQAALVNDSSTIKQLVQAKVDLYAECQGNAFSHAIKGSNKEAIETLSDQGVDPNKNQVRNFGYTAFHEAVYAESTEILNLLLNNKKVKPNLEVKDSFGKTPLEAATHIDGEVKGNIKRLEVVYCLLKNGAKINHPNELKDFLNLVSVDDLMVKRCWKILRTQHPSKLSKFFHLNKPAQTEKLPGSEKIISPSKR
jgi:ankyrin repeat protein